MLINEVLQSNKIIIILAELDTNFTNIYPRIIKLSKSLHNNKQILDAATMANMTTYLDSFIVKFEFQSQRILNTKFDSKDNQIKKLIRKIKRMNHNIKYLRKTL